MHVRRDLEDQPSWAVAVLAGVIALCVYLPTATWDYRHVNDVRATTLAAWSIAERGTFDVPTEALSRIPWVKEVDGDVRIHRTPGPILWAALFYLPGEHTTSVDSIQDVPFGPATASAVVASALGIGAMAAVLRRLASARVALGSALLLAFGTGNWSVSADGAWTHGLTLLFLSVGLLAMSADRFASGGLAMAGSIIARPQTAIAPLVIGLWAGVRRRQLRPIVLVGLTSLIGVAGLAAWYVPLFGEWLPRSQFVRSVATGNVASGGASGLMSIVQWLGSVSLWLVSPSRGLFVFSPFLLLLLPVLRRGWGVAPEWVQSAAVAGVLYSVVQSRGNVWHGGGDYFGYRLPLEMLTLTWPLLTVTFVKMVHAKPRSRALFLQVSLASVLVFGIGGTLLSPIGPERFEQARREISELVPSIEEKANL